MSKTEQQLKHLREQVENAIERYLPSAQTRPGKLHEAMRYSMSAGGKRLRPVLLICAADLFGNNVDALPAAVAIECLHTYTLIHDDLPCVDNSNLRRGVPTCHCRFDEATALLAGDALLTFSFELLSHAYTETPVIANKLVKELSNASGSQKLIGGQMEDIDGEDKTLSPEDLNFIHLNKTAALISAALVMGGCIGNADDNQLMVLRNIGRCMGLAFQIIDDILDVVSDTETMGKETQQDAENGKNTYISLHGLDASRKTARELTDEAIGLARKLPGNPSLLIDLIEQMGVRIN